MFYNVIEIAQFFSATLSLGHTEYYYFPTVSIKSQFISKDQIYLPVFIGV